MNKRFKKLVIKTFCRIVTATYVLTVPFTYLASTNTERVNSLLKDICAENPGQKNCERQIKEEIYKRLRIARERNYSGKITSDYDMLDKALNKQDVFQKIYDSDFWGSSESKSGPGSQINSTENIRESLPKIFEKYSIKTVLDAPCGDYNWMRTVDKTGIEYTGGDIVPKLVRENNKKFKDENTSFKLMDITTDEIPKVDLILCRDCLQHLSYKNVKKTLKNFKDSGSEYLLVTNYPWTLENHDIKEGDFAPLNLSQKPFNLSPTMCVEKIKESNVDGNLPDKYLYLYRLEDINTDEMLVPEETPDHISIAMSLDENYVCPTVVAITSVMENSGYKAKYDFYIMHPSTLSEKSKETLLSLQDKYDDCSINLIDMQDRFRSAYTDSRITTPAYYRLMLSELLPDLDKIIWLDGDVLVFKDLTEMFNIDMDGYCYKAFLDFSCFKDHIKEFFDVYTDHYICDGVMVVNLKELRKENAVKKFEDFISKYNSKLQQHDQTVINAVFADKIGVLPAKFGFWNWLLTSEFESINHTEQLISPEKYTNQEMLNARLSPTVLHCTIKPWYRPELTVSSHQWWQYAEKTDIFNDIKAKYLIPDGTYTIVSDLDSNKVLDINNASSRQGAKLQLWDKNNTNAQQFKVTYDKDGYYTIQSVCSGKLIDVPNGSNKNDVQLWQYDNNNTDAQKWYIIPNKNGTYRIISKCNGMNMDVKNAETKNGTPIKCCGANGNRAQNFIFVKSN